MRFTNKLFINMALAALSMPIFACGGGKPNAGPAAVKEPQPPILDKYDSAVKLATEQKYLEAAQLFKAIYSEQPKLTHALYNCAATYELAGETAQAESAYKKYLALQPTDKNGLMGLIRTSLASGNIGELLEKVELQLSETPNDKDLLLNKATLQRLNGEPEKAIATARQIILRDQKNLAALKLIGMSYVDLGQLDMATTFFNNALLLAPDDTSLQNSIGVIQFNKGDHNEALETFNKSLSKGADPIATANIGLIALKFRDYQKATDSLTSAIDGGLKNCEIYKALGYANEGLQQGDAAITALESASKLCGNDLELLYDMAKIYNVLVRDYGKAKPLYSKYIAQNGARSDEAKNALEVISQIEASQQEMDNVDSAPAE